MAMAGSRMSSEVYSVDAENDEVGRSMPTSGFPTNPDNTTSQHKVCVPEEDARSGRRRERIRGCPMEFCSFGGGKE